MGVRKAMAALVSIAVLLSASPSEARLKKPGGSQTPLARMSGVNLFHLEPNDTYEQYLAHSDFVENLVTMEWNTFRLPIEWDDYVHSNGDLDHSKVDRANRGLRMLVERLREVHLRTGQKLFLIVDFHQYKFGRICGGVGVPSGIIDEKGLTKDDTNCLFKAFDRFWENQNQVQDRWLEWALAHLEAVAQLMAEHSDWLAVGIEPMNEPQFGMPQGMFASNPITAILNLRRWVSAGGPQKQIDERLVPFYQFFIDGVRAQPYGPLLLQEAFFVAEPFVFDHVHLTFGNPPLRMEVRIDGRYERIQGIAPSVRWIAGPHHYLGAMDPGIMDVLPESLKEVLSRYPNVIFTRQLVQDRIEWITRRMTEAGMKSFFGEWGTQTTLLNQNGSPGGYEPWIKDSLEALDRHTLGHLWWQYQTDPLPSQTGFGILRANSEGRQIMKCRLMTLVFGRCR